MLCIILLCTKITWRWKYITKKSNINVNIPVVSHPSPVYQEASQTETIHTDVNAHILLWFSVAKTTYKKFSKSLLLLRLCFQEMYPKWTRKHFDLLNV